jgi:hypothetical protein
MIAVPVLAEETPGVTAKVYEVRYRDVQDIAKLLVGFQVEVVAGSINKSLKTFTVRATEPMHKEVAYLISKYDIPIRNIEFQFFLLKASAAGEGLKDGLPEKVEKAIKEVASLTRYKKFELIDSPFILTKEGGGAMISGKSIYSYEINIDKPTVRVIGVRESVGLQVDINSFWVRIYVPSVNAEGKAVAKEVTLSTPFSINNGEIIVLGASQIGRDDVASGNAMVTIVTAKIY